MGIIHEQLMNMCGKNIKVLNYFYIPTLTPKLLCRFSTAIKAQKMFYSFVFMGFSTYTHR